ncbi:MAG: glycosyltransferase family 4 protein [Pseudohongiellaceae bacterium]
MRILWVKVGGLWPVNTGGRLRSFHILSELSDRHEVTVLTTHHPDDDPDALKRKLSACKIWSLEHASPKRDSAGFILALFRSWFTALPVDLYKNRIEALHEEVSRRLREEHYDLCIADFLVAVPNIGFDQPVPVIYFSHNVEYMIWQRLCDTQTRFWRKLLLGLEWRKLRRYEKLACQRVNLTLAVSVEDENHLRRIAGSDNIRSIPTGVDLDYFTPGGGPLTVQSPELVFTGSMDWYPNEDAILHFIANIFPYIRSKMPGVTLSVVGRNPGRRLRETAQHTGIRVTGTVDDIRSYIEAAAVYIVPLRVGGGTRLKIFEALSMAKAIVSTSVGAEGLPLKNGTHFLCADDPEEFAAKVVELLQNPALRLKLGEAGRRLVAEHYSWGKVADKFETCCGEVPGTRLAPVGARPI